MKARRSLWAVTSAVLGATGTYLVLAAVRSSSTLADAAVLFGGTLMALATFTLFMAAQEHLRLRALARHMRHPRGTQI